jgi:hypothetical protein
VIIYMLLTRHQSAASGVPEVQPGFFGAEHLVAYKWKRASPPLPWWGRSDAARGCAGFGSAVLVLEDHRGSSG